jgi:putative glycosyltransferase
MYKLLVINTAANRGSTGRISEEIGQTALAQGYECWSAYGRDANPSKLNLIKIGTDLDFKIHALQSRLFDNHGFSSTVVTKAFVQRIQEIQPSIINLHNIHGYFLNMEVLFEYLATTNIPVVWTFHDCWPITGHCSYFDAVHCFRWKTGCYDCPNKHGYPKSIWLDRSKVNYAKKNRLIHGLKNLTIVTPSQWLADIVAESYLKDYPIKLINNGVNLDVFKPVADESFIKSLGIDLSKKVILGVANIWTKRKGLAEFEKMAKRMTSDWQILLVGLSAQQMVNLPENIQGITRTQNVKQLAALYNLADVFVNPTYVDNFPTTNIEALACGTPIITYHTGGSSEAVDRETGVVVEQGNFDKLMDAIKVVLSKDKAVISKSCRDRAVRLYNKQDRFQDYVSLFDSLLH